MLVRLFTQHTKSTLFQSLSYNDVLLTYEVFSNGGWTRVVDFKNLEENVDEEDWDRCFNMNVKSHLWLFHAAKSHLEASEGAFLVTASTAGVKPSGSSLVCCPSVKFDWRVILLTSIAILRNESGSHPSCQGSRCDRSTEDQSECCFSFVDDDGTYEDRIYFVG